MLPEQPSDFFLVSATHSPTSPSVLHSCTHPKHQMHPLTALEPLDQARMLHSSGPELGKGAASKKHTLVSYLFPGARPEPLNIRACTDLDSLPARLLTPPAPASTDKSHHHSAASPHSIAKAARTCFTRWVFSLHFHDIPFHLV